MPDDGSSELDEIDQQKKEQTNMGMVKQNTEQM